MDIELTKCEVDKFYFEAGLLLLYTSPVYYELSYAGCLMRLGHRSFFYEYN